MTTFVTGFFDIGRNTDEPHQKFENYFAWINSLLSININLYFFTTPQLYSHFVYTPRSNLIFKFCDPPSLNLLPFIKKTWHKYITNNPAKDTAEFAAMTLGKFKLVEQAIEDNPFNTGHFGWIDAGLLKISSQPLLLSNLSKFERIRVMLLNYISEGEIQDTNFVLQSRYKVAAGLFTGPTLLFQRFIHEIFEIVNYDLENRCGLEQEYMAIVYRKFPDLFEPYYGDFQDLIVNHNTYQTNHSFIQRIYQDALRHNDEKEAEKVKRYLESI